MADKSIFELNLQTTFATNDRLVVGNYANSDAEAITGQTLINLLAVELDGHGGIASIAKTSSSGTNPVVDVYTITFADTSTTSFSVTNGVKGDTGAQTYVYFRYAHTQPSIWADTTDQPDDWMGVYAGTASTQPTNVSAYAWYEIKGETGDTGAAATITTQNVSYQTSSSGTVAPSGSWTTTIPTVTPGDFLWTRTQLQFNDGTTVTAYSVSRYGIDGSGAVSSVNNISPDSNGNVALTGTDIPLSDNQSIQTHVDDAEDDIDALQTSLTNGMSDIKSDLGIVEDGNTATHAIAQGQYVIWKGSLYTASSAISVGATLSGSNLTAVSNGGFNDLKIDGDTGYIKYPDGTMICYGGVTVARAAGLNTTQETFAKTFTTVPRVFVSISTSQPERFIPSFNNVQYSTVDIELYNAGSAASSSTTVNYIAFGRWK